MKSLGLDLGANSLGWCLTDLENNRIVDMGSRVFPAAVENYNTKKEQSKNVTRRESRQSRRMNQRRRRRKQKLWNFFKYNNFVSIEKNDFVKIDPYEARANCVKDNYQATLTEIARSFFHIIQRRGFKSNRRAGDNEASKIYKGSEKDGKIGISELQSKIEETNSKTLGDYFNKINPQDQRRRNTYTLRAMYENEFDEIWENQAKHYPYQLNKENYDKLFEIIFYQRPLKSQKHLIGKCKFEKDKTRCYKSHPDYQEFRMLQKINSLRLMGNGRLTEEEQILTEEERTLLINHLSNKGEIKLDKIDPLLKVLKLDKKGNYQTNMKDKIMPLNTIIQLKKVFGEKFYQIQDDLTKIWNTLLFFEDKECLLKYAKKTWQLSHQQAEKFSKIKLEQGFGELSLKAIKKILPFLREGYLYNEAALKAGYDHSFSNEEVETLDYLPEPETIANPVVMVALHELRKMVNDIIDIYGKPNRIVVEMARDLSRSAEERNEILSKNEKLEKENDKVKEELEKAGISINRDNLLKYKLWLECDKVCPYTGKSINFFDLFGEYPQFQIEHIIPYSRSLDNSFMNKTLCHVDQNHAKSNKTPYEAYSNNSNLYQAILERVKKLPYPKAKRFSLKEFKADEDFITRQLNDTRYISKYALQYLKKLGSDVYASAGQATAYIRTFWGLNNILNPEQNIKNREDHRHHSVDAAVLSIISRSWVQRLSNYSKMHGFSPDDSIDEYPQPWENFRADLRFAVSNIIVSHKKRKRVRGQLHDGTNYGMLKDKNGNPIVKNKKYTLLIRKKLEDLTDKMVLNIVDDVVRKTLIERLIQKGVSLNDINSGKFKIPKDAFDEPIYLIGSKSGKLTPINKVRIKKQYGTPLKIRDYEIYAETGGNYGMAIYATETGEIKFKTITRFEANKNVKQGLEPINKTNNADSDFIMSIMINDMFLEGDFDKNYFAKENYHELQDRVFRVQKFSQDGRIALRLHRSTRSSDIKTDDLLNATAQSIFTKNLQKIKINRLGFIEPSDD